MKKFLITTILVLAVMALFCGCNNAAQEDTTATTSSQVATQQMNATSADITKATENAQYKPEYTEENELEIMTIPPSADIQEPTVFQTEPDIPQKETENIYEGVTEIELPFVPIQ